MIRGPILHADADAFFASVVMRHQPALREIPMAVVAHVIIASANYPARALGVKGGMLVQEALHKCPQMVLIDVPRDEVEDVSDELFALFNEAAEKVEPGSMEEGFLDVGARSSDQAIEAATALRQRAERQLGITLSVGIGRTKLMAKLGSRAAKPDGIHVIDEHEEARLRSDLPIGDVWGIGSTSRERLRQLGVVTLADLDSVPADRLRRVCGTGMARRLASIRDGSDDAVVRGMNERQSLTSEVAASGYERRDWTVDEMLATCTERVCRRAASAGLAATGLKLTFLQADAAPIVITRGSVPATADALVWHAVGQELLGRDPLPKLTGVRVALTGMLPAEWAMTPLF